MEFLINAYDYFRPGGTIMLLLVLASLWMWGLVFERLICFWRMERTDVTVHQALVLLHEKAPLPSAAGICRRIISGFLGSRTGSQVLDQRLLDQYALEQRPRIRRFLPLIAVLAATAPLLGLLGTVTGMIATFDVIAIFGTGNAKALSGGISKALITTQSGLLVGIPGLFMSRLLMRRADAIERRLTETVMALKRAV
ncbi:biopolymer transporter ExbB [Desulfosarcina ovata subsp. sediminis]|uniref:Biopolymer transporter ExbB n=1 Tax=Desulfosarcina ovata subsp. sediminis TaxID=885957 RepID=A0A5K7ZZ82_9BACT|nr:MotA/TolQ/ExbB proton channel family protein [Desulfosarcina ovata]BBO85464.1 biopolymer transporter ExbB [Desulfosarcina ovata subsp. sediminis]